MGLSAKKPTRIETTLKDEALDEIKKEEVSKFNANIPKNLYINFFMKCKRDGKTMTDVIIEFMKDYTTK